jgi:transposase
MIGEIIMSQKEVSRADVFSEISQKKINQTKAAGILGLSARHVRRLYHEYLKSGVSALISKQRGKPSNHQMPKGLKARISELITIDLYSGFGPTFMCEKLLERHGIEISVETIRKLMMENGIWQAHRKKRPVIHQQRKRRARCGELVQIDGSPHAWFEDRGEKCVLISFVDDATGQTYGRFFKSETTAAYMITARTYFSKYGRPLTFYSDKHSIFRINRPGCLKKELITQFARACKELEIKTLCAHSPQAKGRVERNNQTQQDRLVKELRLAGISTIDQANEFLDNFYWDTYNVKFSVQPESSQDAHRKLLEEHNLKKILSYKSQGTLSKNLEVQCDNVIYQITLESGTRILQKAKVMVIKSIDGEVYIEHNGKELPFKIYAQQEASGKIVDPKELDTFFNERKRRKPSYTHPWNTEGRARAKIKEHTTQLFSQGEEK